MSIETRERAEAKRQEILKILEDIFLECAAHNDPPDKFIEIINKHIGAIKGKLRPQENHFVISAVVELKTEIQAFKNNPYCGVIKSIHV